MKNDLTKPMVGLIPLLLFLLIFIFLGYYTGSYYTVPVLTVFIITSFFSFFLARKIPYEKKLESFCVGAGNKDIILMILIFLLAGIFSFISKEIGAINSSVILANSLIPINFMAIGLFLTALIISTAMGSGVGTIVALIPIAIGISDQTSLCRELLAGSVIGGAMFGDNLSFISDTTIASTRTQGCQMRDKFISNFWVVLPAALITLIIYFFHQESDHLNITQSEGSASFLSLVPFTSVLIFALLGLNVLKVLSLGIILSLFVGFFNGTLNLNSALIVVGNGLDSMLNLSILSMISGGLVGLIQLYGGPDFLIDKIKKYIKGQKLGELTIAFLVSLTDLSTANNTVSIIMIGPMAKDIAKHFKIRPERSASILDIFAAGIQGVLPYGAQLLVASELAGISPFHIMKYLYYPYLMLIMGLVSIFIPFKQRLTENV